jgi:CheY-like chemotaxis protein
MPAGSPYPDKDELFLKQVLLIEDNAGDVLLIKQVISQATFEAGIRVALDGEQALQILADSEFKPALIILDLNIPKVSGLDVLAHSKPTAPVVVFSSSSNPIEAQQAIEFGVREFVQKPSDFEEYAKAVMKMIQDWGILGSTAPY